MHCSVFEMNAWLHDCLLSWLLAMQLCYVQAEQRLCLPPRLVSRAVPFHLNFNIEILHGPGRLTVAIEGTTTTFSEYLELTGHAKALTVDLSDNKVSLQPTVAVAMSQGCSATANKGAAYHLQNCYSTPAPLTSGAAIQLQTLPLHGPAKTTPFYAVSEELVPGMLDVSISHIAGNAAFKTAFDSTLQSRLGLSAIDHLTCPESVASRMPLEPQLQSRHRTTNTDKPDLLEQSVAMAWLPWVLCLGLLLCSISLAMRKPQGQADLGKMPSKAQMRPQEPSHVDSNQDLITPTKDTGCSPFVPVGLTQPVPFAYGHLASCSSKIGSYKTPKPATSKGVTNMTSNVSGLTKWQRSKNGRLLSHAMQDPDELTSGQVRR